MLEGEARRGQERGQGAGTCLLRWGRGQEGGGCGGVAEELYEFLSCELRGVTDFKCMRKTNLRESSPQRDVLIPPASPLAPNPLQAAR